MFIFISFLVIATALTNTLSRHIGNATCANKDAMKFVKVQKGASYGLSNKGQQALKP